MDPHLCVGIDVGCRVHRVGIAHPDGTILEEVAGSDLHSSSSSSESDRASCMESPGAAWLLQSRRGF